MKAGIERRFENMQLSLRRALLGPHVLAFLPALALAAFWIGGEAVLIAVSLGVPMLFAMAGGFGGPLVDVGRTGIAPDLADDATAGRLAEQALLQARESDLGTACVLIEIDGFDTIARRLGDGGVQDARDLCLKRMRGLLRRDDVAMRVGDARFLVVLAPAPRLDLEALLQVSARLQNGLEEPMAIEASNQFVSATIGFCAGDALRATATGPRLIEAAQTALHEAQGAGPSAIRAWSESMNDARHAKRGLQDEIERALDNGQIQPWFQPQLCTSTGRISGAEALARWLHPERGVIPPAQFLACLHDCGRMETLSEVMLQHAMTALRGWDQAGIDVPRISVNFSDTELRNPALVDKVKWELDRFGLTPGRLCVEVLETVIADSPDGVIARNLAGLAELGCHIDLDDFGTGHASITALRRFPIQRLKIDRSLVSRVDRDEDQRRMLTAVLSMAERLGLETLAEGVETVGEHALLAQLGCHHVQGFGIARPMPADMLADWAEGHAARIAEARKLGRSTG